MDVHAPQGVRRRGQRAALAVALIVGAALLGIGCNPLTLSYFLFAPEHREPAKCPLADPDREVTIVIVAAHANLEPLGPLAQSHEELGTRLARMLEAQFKENEEKVKIVPPMQVRAYQNRNPRWREDPPQKIGKHFKADYVINLEVDSISLADPKIAATLYQGRAEIAVTVTDVNKPVGEGEKFDWPYSIVYPKRGPMDRDSMAPAQFRAVFLDRIAKDLTYLFASHAPREKYISD